MKTLILASSSPRRQQLLKQVNIPFQLRIPNIDESTILAADPVEKVKQLAMTKAKHVPFHDENEVILAADTVIAFERTIFEKPKDKTEAYQMIAALSGNAHDVYTGVMIRSQDDERIFVERTQVVFWPLTQEEIEWYISTSDPYDKAGAYGIQSLGSMFVKEIVGDYYNVVGLPLSRVVRELRDFSIYPNIS